MDGLSQSPLLLTIKNMLLISSLLSSNLVVPSILPPFFRCVLCSPSFVVCMTSKGHPVGSVITSLRLVTVVRVYEGVQ
jgi:hypothetical protein